MAMRPGVHVGGTRQIQDDVFRLRQEVGRLTGQVASLVTMYEDMAFLVETLMGEDMQMFVARARTRAAEMGR